VGTRRAAFADPAFSWKLRASRSSGGSGYLYDATTLPTFIGPIGRRYYFSRAVLTPEERAFAPGSTAAWRMDFARSSLFSGLPFRPAADRSAGLDDAAPQKRRSI